MCEQSMGINYTQVPGGGRRIRCCCVEPVFRGWTGRLPKGVQSYGFFSKNDEFYLPNFHYPAILNFSWEVFSLLLRLSGIGKENLEPRESILPPSQTPRE